MLSHRHIGRPTLAASGAPKSVPWLCNQITKRPIRLTSHSPRMSSTAFARKKAIDRKCCRPECNEPADSVRFPSRRIPVNSEAERSDGDGCNEPNQHHCPAQRSFTSRQMVSHNLMCTFFHLVLVRLLELRHFDDFFGSARRGFLILTIEVRWRERSREGPAHF